MPIECRFDVEPLSRSQFYEVDHLVMGHAFDIQNELGRFYNEHVYHAELIGRCLKSGLNVLSEGEIVVSCESFKKSYFIDALVNAGSVYELKAVDSLGGTHDAQTLNYLLLSSLQFGKLINFSSPSIQHRFVTSNLSVEKRMNFEMNEDACRTELSSSLSIRDIVQKLLTNWGAFLDVGLYREAIHHFLGGEDVLIQPVEVVIDGRVVGHQKICRLDDETCLHVSSTIRHFESYKKQLLKLLSHTPLKQLQWVNFNRKAIQLITLEK